jgi:glycosyltransferase involved in cell wall biosynthesis
MRIVMLGFFASEYPIGLANALAKTADVTLFLSRQNLLARFPGETHLNIFLYAHKLLDPRVSLRLVNYPKGKYWSKFGMARDLVRAIEQINPDVIHYQSGGDPWVPLALLWLRQYPLVVTIHDAKRHLGDGAPEISLNTTNTLITRLAQQVIVHGCEQASKLTAITHVQLEKMNVVPIGSFDLFDDLSTEIVPQEKNLVLFFGRMRPYKGLEVLLKAVPEIAAQVPGVRFVIAGSGLCPGLYQAAWENPQWFELHNTYIEANKVSAFFQRASLVVQPYLEASQSGIVPIAYKHSRPVVATRVGSIPEVVDDGVTGLLVEPGDVHALAQAVVRLLQNDDLREQMGRQAAEKLARDLSWDAIAQKTRDIYIKAYCLHPSARKPRVLVVGPGAAQVGGLATFVSILLSSEILQEKYELIHFDTTRGAHGKGVASQFHPINILYFLKQSAALVWIGLTRHPAILHVPITSYWAFWKDAAFILMARMLGMKVVAHLHGGLFKRYFDENPPLAKKLIGWMMRRANVVIALSDGWKKFLLTEIRPDLNVQVVPNTVDASFAHMLSDNHNRPVHPDNSILFMGSLGTHKGVFDILKAVPLVLKQQPDAHFIFAGTEAQPGVQAQIDQICQKNGFNESVQFLGQVVGPDKLALFMQSSIFLLPSYGENLPYVLLEAMGAGLPVVTCPVGAIPELVEDGTNGFLIEPGDYQALADRILRLLQDRQLRDAMSETNIRAIRQTYLPEIAARRFDQIYAGLLKNVKNNSFPEKMKTFSH